MYNVPMYEYTSLPGKKNDHLNLTSEISPRAFDGFPLPVGTDLNFFTEQGRLFMVFHSCPPCRLAGHLPPHIPYTPHCPRLPPAHFVTKRLVPDSVKLFATGPASFNLKFLSPQVHLPDPKKKKKKKKYHLLYDAFLDSPSQSELCLMWSWFTPNLTCEPFTLRGKHLRGTGWC